MCRGAPRPLTSKKEFKNRVIRPLKKKFARRKSSPGSTKRLFEGHCHYIDTGILFGQKIYFLKTTGRKKGRKVIKHKLEIEELPQQVHQDLLYTVSRALFEDDSDDESTVYSEVESRYGLDVSLYGTPVPNWYFRRLPTYGEANGSDNNDTSTEDDVDSIVTQDTATRAYV